MVVSCVNRRSMLRGTGGSLMALPALEAFAESGSDDQSPMRLVCIGINFGMVPQLFFPTDFGKNYVSTPRLKPIEHLRDDFTIFSGLDHGVNAQGGHGGVHAFLSGVLSKNSAGMPEANISLDQKAAQLIGSKTRYASLQLASGNDVNHMLSWNASGVAIPPMTDIESIYRLLFQQTPVESNNRTRQRMNSQRSLLDLVKNDMRSLSMRVGARDRRKLDQYSESVRAVERRIGQAKEWLDRPKADVNYKLPRNANQLDFVDRVPLYYDLMSLALQTDSTRVISLALADIGANYGGFNITRGYHQLTHHGKVPEYIKELSVIEQFHMEQFGRFLDNLSSMHDGVGHRLLDRTMVLFGSGMGNASSHSNKNLPIILAGGGFRHGEHRSYFKDDRRKASTLAGKLFVSMLQRFGVETDSFNAAKGTLSGFELI